MLNFPITYNLQKFNSNKRDMVCLIKHQRRDFDLLNKTTDRPLPVYSFSHSELIKKTREELEEVIVKYFISIRTLGGSPVGYIKPTSAQHKAINTIQEFMNVIGPCSKFKLTPDEESTLILSSAEFVDTIVDPAVELFQKNKLLANHVLDSIEDKEAAESLRQMYSDFCDPQIVRSSIAEDMMNRRFN